MTNQKGDRKGRREKEEEEVVAMVMHTFNPTTEGDRDEAHWGLLATSIGEKGKPQV